MEQSFIDYSMSVITERALPDVRDGLKPVHRRILYAMFEEGTTAGRAYKKSARMVGNVIGKYHPHGDTSVYGAAVRMAQSFSMLEPLIDGQGNFGSIDGDAPAAMRYSEMRLSKIATDFFSDLPKETVTWLPNYDGSETEPQVLTVPYPNLLVNGSEGIAVGMATLIPPHNLRCVIAATKLLMTGMNVSDVEVAKILEGPDFPTRGLIHGLDGFADAVSTGRGKVKLRAKWHAETRGSGSLQSLIIDELPYQVNKSTLVEKIAFLVREKIVEDIADMRDESNKDGIRIWIAIKKDASPEAVFSALMTKTELEISYNYNCVALDKGIPRTLGLRQIIEKWIIFRKEVVLARYVFERKKAIAKLHILNALIKALSALDEVIRLIRAATDSNDAKTKLMELLDIDPLQAQSILDIRLQKLTGMEIDSIRADQKEIALEVDRLTEIIDSQKMIQDIIIQELDEVSAKFGKDRQTEIGQNISAITCDDVIAREDVLISLTDGGYIKRTTFSATERQNRIKRATEAVDDDPVRFSQKMHSHDSLILVAKSGQVYSIKVHRIPDAPVNAKGRHIRNVIDGLNEEVYTVLVMPEKTTEMSLMTVSKKALIKRSSASEYSGASRKGGIQGVSFDAGDELFAAYIVSDKDQIILVSSGANAIRFNISEVRNVGRTSVGVRGMNLDAGDDEFIIGAMIIPCGDDAGLSLCCIGSKGAGKRSEVSEFPSQSRAGKGVVAFKVNNKTGQLVAALGVRIEQDVAMCTSSGISNRLMVEDIRLTGRSAAGVTLMNLDNGQTIVSANTTFRTQSPRPADTCGSDQPLNGEDIVSE